jgi:glycosyltransferase involved in cell wall biosynthesis
MPVRDAAATLPTAVESILDQTETDWELVAVDDGSTDASARLLDAYARRDPRVRVLATGPRGLVPALNLGLQAARAS